MHIIVKLLLGLYYWRLFITFQRQNRKYEWANQDTYTNVEETSKNILQAQLRALQEELYGLWECTCTLSHLARTRTATDLSIIPLSGYTGGTQPSTGRDTPRQEVEGTDQDRGGDQDRKKERSRKGQLRGKFQSRERVVT